MKRLDNKNTYEVITTRARYAVTLERLKNTNAGNPRFSANIITLEIFGEKPATDYFYTVCYNFNGHYRSEQDEAREVVRKHEETINE